MTILSNSRSPTIGDLSAQCTLNKGVPFGWYNAKPGYIVDYTAANMLGITVPLGTWEYTSCDCRIDCSVDGDVTITGQVPPDGDPSWSNTLYLPVNSVCTSVNELHFDVRVNSPSSQDPLEYLLTFTDVFGNIRILSIYVLRWVLPDEPVAVLQRMEDPGTQWEPGQKPDTLAVNVTIPFTASSGSIKSKVQYYQVQKYVDHPGSKTLLRGWKEKDFPTSADNTIYDYLVLPGRVYGYRVRYKAGEGDTTQWSDWVQVQT